MFAALQRHLSDEEILELTYITASTTCTRSMSRALRTEFDDRDEPIVEVAAPEDFAARTSWISGGGPADRGRPGSAREGVVLSAQRNRAEQRLERP